MSWLNKDVDILLGVIQVICGKYPTGIWDVIVEFPKQYIHTVATRLAPDSQCRAHTPMFGVYSATDGQFTYPGILVGINMNVYNSRFKEWYLEDVEATILQPSDQATLCVLIRSVEEAPPTGGEIGTSAEASIPEPGIDPAQPVETR